jgi:hypothetical protein
MRFRSPLGWLSRNSKALQGAAALSVLLAAIVPVYRWIARSYGSDLAVEVDWNQSTVPPDLSGWLESLSLPLSEIPDLQAALGKNPTYGLGTVFAMADSPVAKRLRSSRDFLNVGLLRIAIHNNANETVSNLRVRLTDVQELWRVSLSGEFLTDKEAKDFDDRMGDQAGRFDVVLPDLPALPADATVSVLAYCDCEFSRIDVSAPEHSFKMGRTVKVKYSWFIGLAEHPFVVGLPIIWILVVSVPPLWAWGKQRALSQLLPGTLYDYACEKAKTGSAATAMVFLAKAFEMGYRNKSHAKTDPDLAPLHDLPEFRELVGP